MIHETTEPPTGDLTGADRDRSGGLPDFLIIGAQKCGTTALRDTLDGHPEIHIALGERDSGELHFFDVEKNWERGVDWYRSHFDSPDRVQGEKTPRYIFLPKCHQRMADTVPAARLIVCLRNPVDRAYSHWNHYNQVSERTTRRGWEVMSFEEVIEKRPDVIQRGLYAGQLASLLERFPREQFQIIISERLRAEPQATYARLCEFLGVGPLKQGFRDSHVREYAEPMDRATRSRLLDRFRGPNEELFDLIGERIVEWGS